MDGGNLCVGPRLEIIVHEYNRPTTGGIGFKNYSQNNAHAGVMNGGHVNGISHQQLLRHQSLPVQTQR